MMLAGGYIGAVTNNSKVVCSGYFVVDRTA